MGSKSVLLRTLVAASNAKRRVLACPVLYRSGAPYGNRTRVTDVKGRCPGPLDEGRGEGSKAPRHIKAFGAAGKHGWRAESGRRASPFSRVRHRAPRLLGGQGGALLQEFDRMLV